MTYFMTFLEGVISFISPCMLPMLPVYISYFGGASGKKKTVLFSAISFVLGFTAIFTLLGLFAGAAGSFLLRYKTALNIICGIIVVIFGLSYLEIIRIPIFRGINGKRNAGGIVSSFLFGLIYSVSLTPCVGAFLGSALALAASSAQAFDGAVLLLVYSLGLGIPFIVSAVLLEKFKSTFNFIKRNYRTINLICGLFLIVIGLLMMFGLLDKFLAIII